METFLEIAALGPLRITQNGSPLDELSPGKAEALLVYLACRGQPLPREAVAELLWPDRPRDQALSNLRVTLSRLRRGLASHLVTTRLTVGLNPESHIRLDVAELESAILAYRAVRDDPQYHMTQEDADRLTHALALYRGEFLEGFHLSVSPAFDEWVLMERERLHLLVLDALQELAALYLALGDHPAGIRQARRLVRLDPLHEPGYRLLMRLLADSGQRSAALRQFEICEQILADELGVVPEAATRALYEALRARPGPRLQVVSDAPPPAPLPIDARGAERPAPACPYRGLSAFGEGDAALFFGRNAFTQKLARAVTRSPVVAVAGPSGSGKSSVVYAGLIPLLKRSIDATWIVVGLRPGPRPFYGLATALIDLLEPEASEAVRVIEARKLSDALMDDKLSLQDVLHRIRQRYPPHSRLLLFVDQFEELYTLCPDPLTRRRFLDALLTPFTPSRISPHETPQEPCCTLLLTLRADFLEQALAYRPLADALEDDLLLLGPMTPTELEEAVTQPAAQRGVHFEPGLVERILRDVGVEQGRLPLLQFALTRLWARQQKGLLTHAAYAAIGGVSQALTRHAENVYASLGPADQELARRILLQLVQPGEGVEDTRRVATREEIDARGPGAPANRPRRAWHVVRRLADARLVVTNRTPEGYETVEIAHEALIRDWERLRAWIDEDRAFRLWQERLRNLLRHWEGSSRDDRALLRGLALNEAERWFTEREAELPPAERDFIAASLEARRARQQAEAAQQAREQALMQRSRNRLRALVVVLTLATLLALGLTAFALRQTRLARANAVRSQSLALATAAQLALQNYDTDLALALALAANRVDAPPPQAQLMLAETAYAPGTVRRFPGPGGPVRDVALLPDGQRALSAADDGVLRLWSLTSGQVLREFVAAQERLLAVAVDPDGRRALSAAADGSLVLWDLESGAILRRLSAHQAPVQAVAFAPSGPMALSGDADGVLILWDVEKGAVQRRWIGHEAAVLSVAIAPDGQTALSGSADRSVKLWRLAAGALLQTFAGHSDAVTDVAFTPDGRRALSVSEDTLLLLWDLESGQVARRFPYDTAGLLSLDVSPDGRSVLTSSLDGSIVLWNLETGQKQAQFLGHGGRVFHVAFSVDGRFALSSGEDGALRLWRLQNGAEERVWRYESGASSLAISRDGAQAATGLANGDIVLWQVSTGAELARLHGHTERVFGGIRFRADGKTLVSASGEIFETPRDNTVRVWDLTSGQERLRLEGHTSNIWDLDLSQDGRYALTASRDGTARLWDLTLGREVRRYESAVALNSVAFGPQDKIALLGSGRELPGSQEEADYSIRLWNLETGQEEGRLLGHQGSVMDIARSPDGRQALSAGLDGLVLLWDLETRQVRRRLTGHRAGVAAVAFSPDGRLAISGGVDPTLILWDLESGTILRRFQGHEDVITDLVFSPDGRSVFSAGGRDRTVRRWRLDLTPETLMAWIQGNRYAPELTCEQRMRYHVEPLC